LNMEHDIMDNYQVLTELKNDSSVLLVKDLLSNDIQVMKYTKHYNIQIMQALKEQQPAGIPKIYDLEEEEDHLLIIEEYIHGRSLRQIYDSSGPLTEEQVITYSLSLCRILKSLHNMNPPIIHRDIKPEHIILTNDGVIKLIDFNGSKEENPEKKQDTVLFGTHNYAAPEQYGFGSSDHRTDIYQLGVTMNYLLTGTFPINSIYEGQLGPVIRKCTQYEADRRYPAIWDLEKALLDIYDSYYRRESPKPSPAGNAKTDKPRLSRNYMNQEAGKDTYMLPGFRTRTPWKMLLAGCSYLFIIYLCATLNIEDSRKAGVQLTGFRLWTERSAVFILLIVPILLICNYRGVLKFYPQKNMVLKIGAILLSYALLVVLCLIVISVLDSIYFYIT